MTTEPATGPSQPAQSGTTAAAVTAASSTLRSCVVGCGGLTALLIVCSLIYGVINPEATRNAAKSTIKADIRKFEASMPGLKRDGLASTQIGDNIEYLWKQKGSENWIKFRDDHGDGSLDQIVVSVSCRANDADSTLAALAIAWRTIEVGSETTEAPEVFSGWVTSTIGNQAPGPVSRKFADTPVSYQKFGQQSGATLLFTIGQQ